MIQTLVYETQKLNFVKPVFAFYAKNAVVRVGKITIFYRKTDFSRPLVV